MTSINTVEAAKHWGKDGEIKFLQKIQFACLSSDRKNVSLTTDEECNNEILLTPKAAIWLSSYLKELVEVINIEEKNIKQVKNCLKEIQDKNNKGN